MASAEGIRWIPLESNPEVRADAFMSFHAHPRQGLQQGQGLRPSHFSLF